MEYSIEIAEFNSSSIRAVARQVGATHMRSLGSANTDPTADARPDWAITLYELNDAGRTRVINTNADCVDEYAEGFGLMEALCLDRISREEYLAAAR